MMSVFRTVGMLFHATPFLALLELAAVLALLLLLTRRFWARPFFGWYRRHFLVLSLGGLIALLVVVYMAPDIFFTLGPGEAGVLWSRFGGGTRTSAPYPEGTFAKLPWNRIYKYDVRFQRVTGRVDATTREGLRVLADLTVRFRVIEARAGLLHKEVGPDYVYKLVLPELGAYARQIFSRRTGEDLYGTQKQEIQEEIFRAMKAKLPINYDRTVNPEAARRSSTDFVELQDLLLGTVTLPPKVEQAVESKFEQMLLNQEYLYRLARERNEMLRKGIEGEGIALFQSKVSEGISDRYLKWKGIDATLELAQSNNAKIVVIGSGKDGLPLILGGFGDEAAGATGVKPQTGTRSGSTAVAPQGSGPIGTGPSAQSPAPPAREGTESLLRKWLSGQADVKDLLEESMAQARGEWKGGDPKARGSGRPGSR